MPLNPQLLLDTHEELIIDLFAGGGGASVGIELATGRSPDVAINHDEAALRMHEANHPTTLHLRSDVFEVDPRLVCGERPVGFLWASPDCTYHSKARGAKPIRDKNRKRRALAWVVKRWAGQVRPRVIMMENVEEFVHWGPLVGPSDDLRPCKKRRGKTFRRFVRDLRQMGYAVDWRELRACDYGAPTIRKRWFCIARCDGQPIVWPKASHGDPESEAVISGRLKRWLSAASCIDWSIPMLSIFATKDEAKEFAKRHGCGTPIRPLADNTLRRVARGVRRYVLDSARPFFVKVPWKTLGRDDQTVAPFTVSRYGEREGQEPRCRSLENPAATVVNSANGDSLVVPIFSPITHQGDRVGTSGEAPLGTVTCAHRGEIGLVAANLGTFYGQKEGTPERIADLSEPLRTQSTENRHALVATLLAKNFGGFYEGDGCAVSDPLSTVLSNGSGHHAVIATNLVDLHGTAHAEDVKKPLQTVSSGGTHHAVVAAHIQRDFGQSDGHDAGEPLGTVTCGGGGHAALIAAFLAKYNGTSEDGQAVTEPMGTTTTVDRFGLVGVRVNGKPRYIADIYMRMLAPRELYRAQGFPDSYIIDRGSEGRTLTKTEQVRMCGNSVCPPVAAALVAANCPELRCRPSESPSRTKRQAVPA